MKFTIKQVILKHLLNASAGRGAGDPELYDKVPGL